MAKGNELLWAESPDRLYIIGEKVSPIAPEDVSAWWASQYDAPVTFHNRWLTVKSSITVDDKFIALAKKTGWTSPSVVLTWLITRSASLSPSDIEIGLEDLETVTDKDRFWSSFSNGLTAQYLLPEEIAADLETLADASGVPVHVAIASLVARNFKEL